MRGVASVLLDHPFSICKRQILSRVDGQPVSERAVISVHFTWQGRHRKEPGATHMRVVFASLTP